uniref:Uncharacterized protein n=1 Tax=Arundo donax TaxID=35708 RepID=A0A0A9C8M1_ARUDO
MPRRLLRRSKTTPYQYYKVRNT